MTRVGAEPGGYAGAVALTDPEPAFAVIRFDDFFDEPLSAANVEDRVTLQKVWPTQEKALAEAERLNGMAAERGQSGVRYFVQPARFGESR